MSDQATSWKRIQSGDRREFEIFYRAHSGRILQFLCHMTGNRQAAADLLQDVFLHFWERTNGFDPARGGLINYVFGIARNRAAEWRRDREQHPAGSGPLRNNCESESGNRMADGLGQLQSKSETVMLIEDAIERLKPESRGMLWLREVEGRSYSELADVFNIPLGTVKSRLFAAREELRELWNAKTKRHP